mmetsp:Transcript_25482/g.59597  ORF Transcript_25482/g.59597 Transcript_25482/m.59597 type:complete len:229 (-) Transcript_25482:514-1200(-)
MDPLQLIASQSTPMWINQLESRSTELSNCLGTDGADFHRCHSRFHGVGIIQGRTKAMSFCHLSSIVQQKRRWSRSITSSVKIRCRSTISSTPYLDMFNVRTRSKHSNDINSREFRLTEYLEISIGCKVCDGKHVLQLLSFVRKIYGTRYFCRCYIEICFLQGRIAQHGCNHLHVASFSAGRKHRRNVLTHIFKFFSFTLFFLDCTKMHGLQNGTIEVTRYVKVNIAVL